MEVTQTCAYPQTDRQREKDDGHLDGARRGAETDGQQHDRQEENHNVHRPQPRALVCRRHQGFPDALRATQHRANYTHINTTPQRVHASLDNQHRQSIALAVTAKLMT